MAWIISGITFITCLKCNIKCPNEDRFECGLDMKNSAYKLFTNACSMKAYARCTGSGNYIFICLIFSTSIKLFKKKQ